MRAAEPVCYGMKRLLILSALAGALIAGPLARAAEFAPDWTLSAADGQSTRLSDEVREQPVVLLFWATWCPYCKALMPHLQSMRLEHGDAVKVLAINFRDKKGDPVRFMAEAGYDFTLLLDGDDVAEQYRIYGTPAVIVVDRELAYRFDLRDLPPYEVPQKGEKQSHRTRAAYLAPYWAAEIRKAVDTVLDDTER